MRSEAESKRKAWVGSDRDLLAPEASSRVFLQELEVKIFHLMEHCLQFLHGRENCHSVRKESTISLAVHRMNNNTPATLLALLSEGREGDEVGRVTRLGGPCVDTWPHPV